MTVEEQAPNRKLGCSLCHKATRLSSGRIPAILGYFFSWCKVPEFKIHHQRKAGSFENHFNPLTRAGST